MLVGAWHPIYPAGEGWGSPSWAKKSVGTAEKDRIGKANIGIKICDTSVHLYYWDVSFPVPFGSWLWSSNVALNLSLARVSLLFSSISRVWWAPIFTHWFSCKESLEKLCSWLTGLVFGLRFKVSMIYCTSPKFLNIWVHGSMVPHFFFLQMN